MHNNFQTPWSFQKTNNEGIIYDFIVNLNRITVLRLITESASDSLNEPYNINSARY